MLPVQCRMARTMPDLRVRDLALIAKVSRDTVARFERGERLKASTVMRLREALQDAGVEFTIGDRRGVRLVTKKAASRK